MQLNFAVFYGVEGAGDKMWHNFKKSRTST